MLQDTDEAIISLQPDVEHLISQGEALVNETKELNPKQSRQLQMKLGMLRNRWNTLEGDASKRKDTLKEAVPRWREYDKDAGEMEMWMDEMERRIEESQEDEDALKVRITQNYMTLLNILYFCRLNLTSLTVVSYLE